MLLSSVFAGFVFGLNKRPSIVKKSLTHKKFDFISSVRAAAQGTVNICAFVTLFTVFSGFVTLIFKNEAVRAIIISHLEVGNASSLLSSHTLTKSISLPLTAFAISFSGLCVHFQAKSLLYGSDVSMNKYYKVKLLQGYTAFVLCYLALKLI